MDLILAGTRRGDHGFPVHPPAGSPEWPGATADLIAGSWFAHVQHTAELIAVALEEVERSQFTAAAATARTALEMAARALHGARQLSESVDDRHTDRVVRWMSVEEGRPHAGPASVTTRVQRLMDETRQNASFPTHLHAGLEGVYDHLCARAHPRAESWRMYARPSNLPAPAIATSPKDREAAKAADDVLTGVAVVVTAMHRAWDLLARVVPRLRARATDSGPPAYTLVRSRVVDITEAHPTVNIEDQLIGGLDALLWDSPLNGDHRPMMAPHVLVDYFGPGRMQEGAVRNTSPAAKAAHALIAARLLVVAELQRAALRNVNLGRCAAAAAQARFLLEHVVGLSTALRESEPDLCAGGVAEPAVQHRSSRARRTAREGEPGRTPAVLRST
ncbi:hypothetical protein [Geodermatophilus sp. DSM 45219]|uniref:hypothetical protein n=1 Tax=Geodermatophilus sp. DSM 45219 TaxID=1881103 RepID=UPI00115FA85F|nr:hypothetical protein [Geodermatophilus sp. DSM 45219]